MAPLIEADDKERLLVSVPPHRWRLWNRGFNQSALIAGQLARRLGLASDPAALSGRAPRPAQGDERFPTAKAVARRVHGGKARAVAGKTIVLVDDATTGSTAEVRARALRRAGAKRIELSPGRALFVRTPCRERPRGGVKRVGRS